MTVLVRRIDSMAGKGEWRWDAMGGSFLRYAFFKEPQ